ncbi:MAG TPA: ABC-F family ATP-binding cassette domain-containing protein [Bacilli bacterium]
MLEVKNLRFSYGDKELYNNLNFKIYKDEHVGLVGANGSGKSTLMNLLAHRLVPDSGEIIWDQNITYSYLDQYLKVYDDLSIKEYLYNVYEELFQKEEILNSLYESLTTAPESEYDKILNKAYNLQNYLEEKNFYMIKSKIGNVINGLGIDVNDHRTLKQLSGGQRVKVFLGKMLLEEKDVLLLDEPTNFLDTSHISWLIKYLNEYKNAYLIISHDHAFLNQVTNTILALENKVITKYKGNYDDYLHQKDIVMQSYEKAYEKQQQYIKKTEEFINKNIVRATTTKRAQSRRKMLEKLDRLEKPQSERKVYFEFQFTKSFNKNPLIVHNLDIGYDHIILHNLNIEFEFGQKYIIIGKNGVGKTTFIKTIIGELKPLGGIVKLSELNDITYYEQEIPIHKETPIQYIRNDYPLLDDTEIRKILAKYGIVGDLALKMMTQLSGGEVAKVRFAKLSLEKSNFLILDEPTNHLDKIAKQSLLKAIANYPGTVILVSHETLFYQDLKMKEIRF